jgi:hypothetical protein
MECCISDVDGNPCSRTSEIGTHIADFDHTITIPGGNKFPLKS